MGFCPRVVLSVYQHFGVINLAPVDFIPINFTHKKLAQQFLTCHFKTKLFILKNQHNFNPSEFEITLKYCLIWWAKFKCKTYFWSICFHQMVFFLWILCFWGYSYWHLSVKIVLDYSSEWVALIMNSTKTISLKFLFVELYSRIIFVYQHFVHWILIQLFHLISISWLFFIKRAVFGKYFSY